MDRNHLDPRSAEGRSNDRGPSSTEYLPRADPTDRSRGARKLVLCFDGTGNKFNGDDSDSNILKIFRMLDREAEDQFHYYQRKLFVLWYRVMLIVVESSWHWDIRRVRVPFTHWPPSSTKLMVPKSKRLGHWRVFRSPCRRWLSVPDEIL